MDQLLSLVIILVAVLVVVILPILFVLKLAKKYIRCNQKFSKICIILYCCILLLSPIVYFLLPNQQELKTLSKDEQQRKFQVHETLAKDLIRGKIEKHKTYHVKDWTFNVKGNEVDLKLLNNAENESNSFVRVFVEWTKSDSQKISASLYRLPYVENNLDLSQNIHEPKIIWKDSRTLSIQNPKPFKIHARIITDKLSILPIQNSMFAYENINLPSEWEMDHDIDLSTSYFLYLKVPNHMDIVDQDNLRIYD